MVLQIEYGLEPRSTLFQTAQRKRRIRQRGCYVPTCGLHPRRFGALVVPLSWRVGRGCVKRSPVVRSTQHTRRQCGVRIRTDGHAL